MFRWTSRAPKARLREVLDALGHDSRPLKILTTLMDGEESLKAKQILDHLRLPDSEMSTLRRDLNALKDSGLVIAKGVKPITYYPAAEKVELRIDEMPTKFTANRAVP